MCFWQSHWIKSFQLLSSLMFKCDLFENAFDIQMAFPSPTTTNVFFISCCNKVARSVKFGEIDAID